MATDPKTSPAALPGVPAAKTNPPALGSTPSSQPAATPAAAPPLPSQPPASAAGSTAKDFGGNRGGKPRLDGHIPGSEEAKKADREKARLGMERLRASQKAAKATAQSVPALPSAVPGVVDSQAPPGSGVVGLPLDAVPAWTPADLQPTVELGVPLVEEAQQAHFRGILKPLALDAAATSRILQPTRWPEVAKHGLKAGAAGSLAEAMNALSVPVALKKHLLSIPAIAYLVHHHFEQSGRLEQLVKEEMQKKNPAPEVPEKP